MDAPYPQYRCPVCDKDLPLTEARLTVTCESHIDHDDIGFEVRDARAADRHDVEEICDRAWGETEFDAFGTTFDVLSGENVVAVADGRLAGLVSLAVHGGELAVVLLTVYPEFQGLGVGSALLAEAAERARGKGLPFVKIATSNDNIPALYFYQRSGFVVYDVACGFLADKHGSAEPGFAGIRVRDEIRLRRPVSV